MTTLISPDVFDRVFDHIADAIGSDAQQLPAREIADALGIPLTQAERAIAVLGNEGRIIIDTNYRPRRYSLPDAAN